MNREFLSLSHCSQRPCIQGSRPAGALPSETTLMQEYGLARETVRKAVPGVGR
jgi:hypothetical protein